MLGNLSYSKLKTKLPLLIIPLSLKAQNLIRNSCWEFNKCGRETGGSNAEEFGICPASLSNEFNDINNGQFAGRFCWAIAGTFCQGIVNGTFAKKLPSCVSCDFLKSVHYEESGNFILTPSVAKKKLHDKDDSSAK